MGGSLKCRLRDVLGASMATGRSATPRRHRRFDLVPIVPHIQSSTFGQDGQNARGTNTYWGQMHVQRAGPAARRNHISACVLSANVGNGLRERIPAIASMILRTPWSR